MLLDEDRYAAAVGRGEDEVDGDGRKRHLEAALRDGGVLEPPLDEREAAAVSRSGGQAEVVGDLGPKGLKTRAAFVAGHRVPDGVDRIEELACVDDGADRAALGLDGTERLLELALELQAHAVGEDYRAGIVGGADGDPAAGKRGDGADETADLGDDFADFDHAGRRERKGGGAGT